ncbi:uncharacterized protein LOC108604706 [Drosophila busckii]|uniref:uncharacterized protein LOC108604706 n=1 Tax=Drosophila busckii TaxID=30019 RepID=UPI001432CF28|nr:uncharacterized protein LOC108604706 [Drosophila busckii]
MIYKTAIVLLILVQCLLAAPTIKQHTSVDLRQEQLEQEAHTETINLLNALFRAQIAYFSGVREKLNPQTKRAQDIAQYVVRLHGAIAEPDMDKKNTMWLNIFEQFNQTPLLSNKQEDTGLSDDQYKALLTDKKLQDITQSFVRDVSAYFWKIAQLSGKVIEISMDDYGKSNEIHK